MNIIISFCLGILIESIYFALFLKFSKNIKEKTNWLIIGIILLYTILGIVINYNIWLYFLLIVSIFILMTKLYSDTEITDLFLVTFAFSIVIISNIIVYPVIKYNYFLAYVLQRLLLFGILFIFKNKWNILYSKYISLWNRKTNAKIRSLTLRAISVVLCSTILYALSIALLYIKI